MMDITEILLFMAQNVRIFKIFRGAAMNPAWGADSFPKDPQLVWGVCRALLHFAIPHHAPYFTKIFQKPPSASDQLRPW